MCNDEKVFAKLDRLKKPQEVTLGDGHVPCTGQGIVSPEMKLPGGKTRR